MRSSSRLLLTTLIAALALGAGVNAASANRLLISNNGFRIIMGPGISEEPLRIVCPATIEGTFHSRTIAKVPRSLVGFITRAILTEERCNGGRLRFLAETLPWHVQFASFSGSLPNISGIQFMVIGLSILAEFESIPGTSCLYRSTEAAPARFRFEREVGGLLNPFRWNEEALIPKFSGSALCPMTAFLFGPGAIMLLGTTTRIGVALI